MRILTEGEVRTLMEDRLDTAFDACEAAYRYYGEQRHVLSRPSSAFLTLPRQPPATCRLKGAHLQSLGVAGARLATPGHYFCWLVDFEGGQPIALVAEEWLHRRRTAATAGLVARWLAPPGARVAALVGAGKMGREYVRTLSHALPLEVLRVASRSGDSARRLVDEFGGRCGATRLVAADTIETALRGADVVATITRAGAPFLQPGWLAPGALLLSMGGVPEVAFGVLAEVSRLIIDDLDYALAQGDLHAWVTSGAITREALVQRIDGDIGEVAVGSKAGRTGPGERILAVIQGMAVCDLAMARTALDLAVAGGVGQEVVL